MLALQPQIVRAQAFQGSATVINGSVSRASGSGVDFLTVNAEQNTINWTPNDTMAGGGAIDFLPTGTTANFLAGSGISSYTVLNRIIAADQSRAISFAGTVNSGAGGSLWFYAPGGLLLQGSARFNVGSLLLTTNDPVGAANGNDYLSANNDFRLRGAAGSTAAIEISNGAQINALSNNSYVIAVAPRITMAGAVQVNGSAALVMAEDVSFTLNGGLFDITANVGSAAGGTNQVDGSITGPAGNSGVGDYHRIYMMAVPRNDAITLLLTGSQQIGFAIASAADVDGNAIILSGGHDIVRNPTGEGLDSFSAQPSAGAGSGRITVNLDAVTLTSNATVRSRDVGQAIASTGQLDVARNLAVFAGENAFIGATNGQLLEVTGDILADASNRFSAGNGANRTAGAASVLASDGNVSVLGNIVVRADGIGDNASAAGQAGGTGTGGSAQVSVASGGSLQATTVTISATGTGGTAAQGRGGAAVGGIAIFQQAAGTTLQLETDLVIDAGATSSQGADGQPTGNASGGLAQATFSTSNNINGGLSITSNALASPGQRQVPLQTGGATIQGGAARLSVLDGGGIGALSLNISATAGAIGSGGGIDYRGGIAEILANSSSDGVAVAIAGSAALDARAFGADGLAGGARDGGTATGGAARIVVDGNANVLFNTNLLLNASATGGNGVGIGNGGSATGGTTRIALASGGLSVAGPVEMRAEAFGGSGLNGGAATASNANAGFAPAVDLFYGTAGQPGQTGIDILGGPLILAARALGGAGSNAGTGGAATGGSIVVDLRSQSHQASGISIDAGVSGGNAALGGNAVGSDVSLVLFNSVLDSQGSFTIDASAQGGEALAQPVANGGTGGNAQFGSVQMVLRGQPGTTANLLAPSLTINANVTGGDGGFSSGGIGGAGGLANARGVGQGLSILGQAGDTAITLGSTSINHAAIGGRGGNTDTGRLGDGGAATGGAITLGLSSGPLGPIPNQALIDLGTLNIDARSRGGDAGAFDGGVNGGTGGTAGGGQLTLLVRGGRVRAASATIDLSATGGEAQGETQSGAGGNATGGGVTVLATPHFTSGTPADLQIAGALTLQLNGTGGVSTSAPGTGQGGSFSFTLGQHEGGVAAPDVGVATIGALGVNAEGIGGNAVDARATAHGHGLGGQISMTAQNGSLSLGSFEASVAGRGGARGDNGTTSGDGSGGTIQLFAQAGSMEVAGLASLFAQGLSGNALGGTVRLATLDKGSRISLKGDIVRLDASGLTGDNSGQAGPGSATGGLIEIANVGDATIEMRRPNASVGELAINADALAQNISGPLSPATGGRIAISNAGTLTLSAPGVLALDVDAVAAGNSSNPLTGGAAIGGEVSLVNSGGTLTLNSGFNRINIGSGAEAGDSAQTGGQATGGTVTVAITGGTANFNATTLVYDNAFAGNASAGTLGNSSGGTVGFSFGAGSQVTISGDLRFAGGGIGQTRTGTATSITSTGGRLDVTGNLTAIQDIFIDRPVDGLAATAGSLTITTADTTTLLVGGGFEANYSVNLRGGGNGHSATAGSVAWTSRGDIEVLGGITISASADIAAGSLQTATGGVAAIDVAGGLFTAGAGLSITTGAQGSPASGAQAGVATAGQIRLTTAVNSQMSITGGAVNLESNANGSTASGAGPATGGDAIGGSILINSAGTMIFNTGADIFQVRTVATGGNALGSGGIGGNATGGSISLITGVDGSFSHVPLSPGGVLQLEVQAIAGNGNAVGGNAVGGTALINSSGSLGLPGGILLLANANGGLGALSGNATGGSASLLVGGGTLTLAGDAVLSAEAIVNAQAAQGNGRGGALAVTVSAGTLDISGNLDLRASANGDQVTGGGITVTSEADLRVGGIFVATADAETSSSGAAPLATGGSVGVSVIGATSRLTVADNIRLSAQANGVGANSAAALAGGSVLFASDGITSLNGAELGLFSSATFDSPAGGNASGGSSRLTIGGGNFSANTLAILSEGLGGEGGGNGTGGIARMTVLGGSASVNGGFDVSAQGVGGLGATGTGGIGLGGEAGLTAGGTVTLALGNANFRLSADGFGGASGSTPGGEGRGGSVQLATTASTGRIEITATGGPALAITAAGQGGEGSTGGLGRGGSATLANAGTLILPGSLTLNASATGGGGTTTGGSAIGGTASASNSGSLPINGLLLVSANATSGQGSATGNATGGSASFSQSGGTSTISQDLELRAEANVVNTPVRGTATGGSAVFANTAGTVGITGSLLLAAPAEGRVALGGNLTLTSLGATSIGGSAVLLANGASNLPDPTAAITGGAGSLTVGASGSLAITGALTVNIAAQTAISNPGVSLNARSFVLQSAGVFSVGGAGLVINAAAGPLQSSDQAGDAAGGDVELAFRGGSLSAPGISVNASATGGLNSAGRGGNATAGTASLTIDTGTTATIGGSIILDASARGGNGGDGGAAIGGTASLFVAGSLTINSASNPAFRIDATALGGTGSIGGAATGGLAALGSVAGGTLIVNSTSTTPLRPDASAFGGEGAAQGGAATGGQAELRNGGSITLPTGLNLWARASGGGSSGIGGAATGGGVLLENAGSLSISGNLGLSMAASGGSGGSTGNATAGILAGTITAGTVTVLGDVAADGNASVSPGSSAGNGTGGTLDLQINGGTLDIAGNLGFAVRGDGRVARSGALSLAVGGRLLVGGSITIEAPAVSNIADAAATATAGTATILVSAGGELRAAGVQANLAASLTQPFATLNARGGDFSLSAFGTVDLPGPGLSVDGFARFVSPNGIGGAARGGSLQVQVGGDGSFTASQISLDASAIAGINFGGAGGSGIGGSASVEVLGPSANLNLAGRLVLNADATGGFGTGAGGSATGGTARLATGSSATIAGLVTASANAAGRNGTGPGANGGAATAGSVQLIADGGTLALNGGADLAARAIAGSGSGGGPASAGGNGGLATGGSIGVQVLPGGSIGISSLLANVSASGGDGATGGTGATGSTGLAGTSSQPNGGSGGIGGTGGAGGSGGDALAGSLGIGTSAATSGGSINIASLTLTGFATAGSGGQGGQGGTGGTGGQGANGAFVQGQQQPGGPSINGGNGGPGGQGGNGGTAGAGGTATGGTLLLGADGNVQGNGWQFTTPVISGTFTVIAGAGGAAGTGGVGGTGGAGGAAGALIGQQQSNGQPGQAGAAGFGGFEGQSANPGAAIGANLRALFHNTTLSAQRITLVADAGGQASGLFGVGGTATGGTAELRLDGGTNTLAQITLSATAQGGSSDAGTGGIGVGGAVSLTLLNGAVLSLGDVATPLQLRADGVGGDDANGGFGGSGQGGNITVALDGADLAVTGAALLSAEGADGSVAGADSGRGGMVSLQLAGDSDMAVSGGLTLSSLAGSGEAFGGTSEIGIDSSRLTVGGGLNLLAGATADATSFTGTASGGTARIRQDGGILDVAGLIRLDVAALAASGSSAQGGTATAGTVDVAVNASGSIVPASMRSGGMAILATATGGAGLLGASGGDAGGAGISLLASSSSATLELGSISLAADVVAGAGGAGSVGGNGGQATGASINLGLVSGSANAQGQISASSITVSANATGGAGGTAQTMGSAGGQGGVATGGSITLRNEGGLITTGAVVLNANATGGAGGSQSGLGTPLGIGGNGSGGTVLLLVTPNATQGNNGITALSSLIGNAGGLGGLGGTQAGNGIGGVVALDVVRQATRPGDANSGALTIGGSATLDASGRGGGSDGGGTLVPGNGSGGQVRLAAEAGSIDIESDASLSARGLGGAAVNGGSGGNGQISLAASSAGQITLLGPASLNVSAQGGDGLDSGGVAEAGSLTMLASTAGRISATGGLSLFADGEGGLNLGSLGSGGNGTGGSIRVSASGADSLITLGETTARASGNGTAGNGDGAGAQGRGGAIEFSALAGGSLALQGPLALGADGRGGFGGVGGSGQGGTLLLAADDDGVISGGADVAQLRANGQGGGGSDGSTGNGGDGEGGGVRVVASKGGSITLGSINLSEARGVGGGGANTGNGGTGRGGSFVLEAIGGGTLTTGSAHSITASGEGGSASGSGSGGVGLGGQATVQALDGGTLAMVASGGGIGIGLFADGAGGSGSGAGGLGQGGSVLVLVQGGGASLTLDGRLAGGVAVNLSAFAFGGNGGVDVGGAALGGGVRVEADGAASLALRGINLIGAGATGGASDESEGGAATGGTLALRLGGGQGALLETGFLTLLGTAQGGSSGIAVGGAATGGRVEISGAGSDGSLQTGGIGISLTASGGIGEGGGAATGGQASIATSGSGPGPVVRTGAATIDTRATGGEGRSLGGGAASVGDVAINAGAGQILITPAGGDALRIDADITGGSAINGGVALGSGGNAQAGTGTIRLEATGGLLQVSNANIRAVAAGGQGTDGGAAGAGRVALLADGGQLRIGLISSIRLVGLGGVGDAGGGSGAGGSFALTTRNGGSAQLGPINLIDAAGRGGEGGSSGGLGLGGNFGINAGAGSASIAGIANVDIGGEGGFGIDAGGEGSGGAANLIANGGSLIIAAGQGGKALGITGDGVGGGSDGGTGGNGLGGNLLLAAGPDSALIVDGSLSAGEAISLLARGTGGDGLAGGTGFGGLVRVQTAQNGTLDFIGAAQLNASAIGGAASDGAGGAGRAGQVLVANSAGTTSGRLATGDLDLLATSSGGSGSGDSGDGGAAIGGGTVASPSIFLGLDGGSGRVTSGQVRADVSALGGQGANARIGGRGGAATAGAVLIGMRNPGSGGTLTTAGLLQIGAGAIGGSGGTGNLADGAGGSGGNALAGRVEIAAGGGALAIGSPAAGVQTIVVLADGEGGVGGSGFTSGSGGGGTGGTLLIGASGAGASLSTPGIGASLNGIGRSGSDGGAGQGGSFSLLARGDAMNIAIGQLSVGTLAEGGNSNGGGSGGNARGGSIGIDFGSLAAANPATTLSLGNADLSADAIGGEANNAAARHGSGTGGSISIAVTGGNADVGLDLVLSATGTAGADPQILGLSNPPRNPPPGLPGTSTGGSINVSVAGTAAGTAGRLTVTRELVARTTPAVAIPSAYRAGSTRIIVSDGSLLQLGRLTSVNEGDAASTTASALAATPGARIEIAGDAEVFATPSALILNDGGSITAGGRLSVAGDGISHGLGRGPAQGGSIIANGLELFSNGLIDFSANTTGSGSLFFEGGQLRLGTLAATGSIGLVGITAGGISTGAIGAGSHVVVLAGGPVSLGAVNTGANGRFFVGDVAQRGLISLNTPPDYAALFAAGARPFMAQLDLAQVSAGRIDVATGGALTATGPITARGPARIVAQSASLADIASTGQLLLTTSAALTANSITSQDRLSLIAGGALAVNGINVAITNPAAEARGDAFVRGASISLGDVNAAGDIGLVTTGNLASGALSSGRDLVLLAGGTITTDRLSTPDAGRIRFGDAGQANLISFSAAGVPNYTALFAAAPTAVSGDIIVTDGIATGLLEATGAGLFQARDGINVAIGGRIRAATVDVVDANSVGFLDIAATTDLLLGDIRADGGLTLSTDGNITAGLVTVGGTLNLTARRNAGQGGNIVLGDVRAEDDIRLTAGGLIRTGRLSAADSVFLTAGSSITTGGIDGGTVNPRAGAAGVLFAVSPDVIRTGPINVSGSATLSGTLGVTTGSITAPGGIVLLDTGGVFSGALTTSASGFVYIASHTMLPQITFDQAGNPQFAALLASAPVRLIGDIGLSGAVSTGRFIAAATGSFAAQAITAGTSSLVSVAGTAMLAGTVASPDVSLTSGNIAIGQGVTIGGASAARVALAADASATAAVVGGNGVTTAGTYSLSGAEFAALRASRISVSINSGTLTLENLALPAIAPPAQGTAENAGIFFASNANLRVTGAVTMAQASSGNRLSLSAGTRIEVVRGSGSLILGASADNPAGTLALSAPAIWVADQPTLDALAAGSLTGDDRIDALQEAPATPSGSSLAAGTLTLAARDTLLIQNGGTEDERAGFTATTLIVSRSGATAGGLLDMAINGRIRLADGTFATNGDTRELVQFTPDTGILTADSMVNGCIIGGICPGILPEGTEQPVFSIVNNVAALTPEEQQQREEAAEAAEKLPIILLQRLIDFSPIYAAPDSNDPVTSGGNPSLWPDSLPTGIRRPGGLK